MLICLGYRIVRRQVLAIRLPLDSQVQIPSPSRFPFAGIFRLSEVAPVMAGQTQVGDRKPGGDSPIRVHNRRRSRAWSSFRCNARSGVARFLFFSAFFFLFSVASSLAIFCGDFSLGAISHLRCAPADTAVWAVMDSNSIPQ